MPLIEDEMNAGAAPAAETLPAEGETLPPESETPAAAAEAPAAKDEALSEDGEAATPEEQAAYEKVVLAGLKILYDEKSHAPLVKMLQTRADQPAEALADTTISLVQQVDQASKGTVPQAVILPAAAELLDEVANLARTAGAFDAPQPVLAHAVQIMILGLANSYGIDKAELEQFMASVDVEKIKGSLQQGPQGAQAANEPAPAQEAA